MKRRRAAVIPFRALAILLCAVLLAGTCSPDGGVNAVHTPRLPRERRTPARRSYSTHSYYVLELRDGSTYSEAEHATELLGAEMVEQVGQLRDHWLIRAPYSGTLTKRSDVLEDEREEEVERDHVMDSYYALLQNGFGYMQTAASPVEAVEHNHRRSIPIPKIDARSSLLSTRSSILSLERQVLKKRVKRDYLLEKRTAQSGKAGEQNAVSQYLRDLATRLGIQDPLWSKQWHLANDVIKENSINVTDVWAQGVTGKGIRVAIVDDGLDMYSDDLKDNFFADGSWDYNDHTDLPEPRLSDDQHGTRCAGEIAALRNDVCGVGVAYDAQVAGIRILSASISDADEASALNFGYQENDIYSCSWGPPDDGRSMEAPSRLIYKSMLNGVQNGRGGKGSVFVFASGNGGAVDDQCNFDGYTNSIFSITISAIDRKGLHPFYSEGCSANMVVTYSSGSGDYIHTTDVGKDKCTDHHGGTSAAAPIAAGIFALALQVRPELTWRDLQHICVRSAVQVNPTDPDWQVTYAGRPYNHKYGYGKLDAYRIVEYAKEFAQVKPQTWYESPVVSVDKRLNKEGITSTISISSNDLKNANFEALEHVQITVNAQHQRRGNMEVWLESPNGVKSILARPRRFDEDQSGYPSWTFMSVKHWDENPVGNWTLTMLDRQTNDKNGTFIDWQMMLWGQAADASLATIYKMPYDDQVQLPAPPHHTILPNLSTATTTITSDGSTWVETTLMPVPHEQTTKSYARPTAHLPEDHGQATGESDHPLDHTMTPTPAEDIEETVPTTSYTSPAETASASAESAYVGPWSSLVGSSTWLYIAAGSVIIFLGGAIAFLTIRRKRRGTGFQLVAGVDDDGHPMSALERGRMRLTGQQSAGRTKALYDAFALSDSDDDDSDPEREGLVPGQRKMDDTYMSSFLEDDEPATSPAGPRSSTPDLERYRDEEGQPKGVA